LFPVIAKSLTVVRQQHDCRAIVELMRLQIPDQATDNLVGLGDGKVVRSGVDCAGVCGCDASRFIEVHEQKHPVRPG
jgi:hypothetical protein